MERFAPHRRTFDKIRGDGSYWLFFRLPSLSAHTSTQMDAMEIGRYEYEEHSGDASSDAGNSKSDDASVSERDGSGHSRGAQSTPELAQEESRLVSWLRLMFMALLVASGCAITVVTYRYTSDAEKDVFRVRVSPSYYAHRRRYTFLPVRSNYLLASIAVY